MFASLQNKFSNYRTCSLRFDIEGNIIIEGFASLRFASLRFDNHVICLWCFWTCLYYRGLCCSWRCLHYRGLSCIWTCLHYREVYCSWRCLPQGPSCIWTCLHYKGVYCSLRCLPQGLSCIWMCLHYRGLWCCWRCLPQRPEQNLDVSALQGLVHTSCRTCSLCFENNLLNVGSVHFASKILFLLSNVFALLRKKFSF